MLAKLKSAPPKLRLFLGVWLGLELLSLPAAAGFMLSLQKPTDEGLVIVEAMPSEAPGLTQFLVTHVGAFDIAVAGGASDIHVMIEDAKHETPLSSNCARLSGGDMRVVKTVPSAGRVDGQPGAVFVTLVHDTDTAPAVHIQTLADVPDALPCQSGRA
ncbi:MAG: hypothetical protein WBG08_08335 [Litorimonas sp.]